jgi:murein DD-endopeptidase MepM/ murein hydrolase activator NlpD
MSKSTFIASALTGMVLLCLEGTFAIAHPRSASSPSSLETKAGEVLYITVSVKGQNPTVVGEFRHRTIPFFKIDETGRYGALIGFDLSDEPAQDEVRVQVQEGLRTRLVERYRVKVLRTQFGIQELTLPQEKVDLDPETLKRVEEEQQQMLENLSSVREDRLWKGPFVIPVQGKVAGTFGLKRVINGQPRNPHSGEDIYAPEGTAVAASNHGVVKLTGDFFFSGKSIVIDHGLGVFTMYFHLSEIFVKEGEPVPKGQTIGLVGSTGRVTGPHLHWGARLNGARVNPLSLIKLPLNTLSVEE